MRRTNKKGFTIVELVIVIAVIAILAAVLIPTFASLVNKANQSADIQAVKQMNTQLAIAEADGKIESIGAAVSALAEVKINLDNYTPLTTGTQFYWVKSENRVIYVDLEKNEVLYPEEYKSLEHKAGDWLSLNGDIETKDYTITTTGEGDEATKAVEIKEAGQLAKLIDDYNNGKNDAKSVTKITLTDNIDLAGATCKFVAAGGGESDGFAGQIEIDGNGKTIYGFRDDQQTLFGTGEFANRGYGYGLFANIGKTGQVSIKNVTFSGLHVQDTSNSNTGTMGLIAGYVYGSLTLDNVTIENSTIVGKIKVGAVVGRVLEGGSLTIQNSKISNVTVGGLYETAALVGRVDKNATFVSDNNTVENVEVYLHELYNARATELGGEVKIDSIADASYFKGAVSTEGYLYPALTDKACWKYSESSTRIPGSTSEYYDAQPATGDSGAQNP